MHSRRASHAIIYWGELSKSHTGSSQFNHGMIVMFLKVYAINIESPSSQFNRGTSIVFPKVYISSMEGSTPGMMYCMSRVESACGKDRTGQAEMGI